MIENNLFKNVIDDLDAGYWELNNNSSYWSSAFIQNLGYNVDDVDIRLDFFLEHIIHKRNRPLFQDNFYDLVRHDRHFKQKVLLLSKDGEYKEFVCKSNEELPVNIQVNSKVLFFFEAKENTLDDEDDELFYFKETAEMTSTGSWFVDFENKKSHWDLQTKRILEYPDDFVPSLKMAPDLYAEEHQQLAADAFLNCAMTGKAFNIEIKMVTANKKVFWARAIGKPVYGTKSSVVGIRGVFQDIDDHKQKEEHLQKTSDLIASQNSRLFNFAHIVSHNLRSHSSNLALIVQLIEETEDKDEKLSLLSNIGDISESLNMTIAHLNEVVTIQTNTNKHKEKVSFETILNQVTNSIGSIIRINKASIQTDFSKAESIEYIPAYLESILLNLLTNAIKYKHSDRDPEIYVKTYLNEDKRVVLELKDNGAGIDLEKFGDKLFGMYKTFHYNSDAVGIGLFITKNQIEALNGEIKVESEVNKGTKFVIIF